MHTLQILTYEFYYKTEGDFLYLFTTLNSAAGKITYTIKEYNLRLFEETNQYSIITSLIKCVSISSDRKYLCVGEEYKISTFLIKEKMRFYNSQIYHDGNVVTMTLTPNDMYLFSAGDLGEVKMIDTEKMKDPTERNIINEINHFKGEIVINIVCTKDSSKILIISNEILLVWSVFQQSPLKFVKLGRRPNKIILSNLHDFFFLKNDDSIEV